MSNPLLSAHHKSGFLFRTFLKLNNSGFWLNAIIPILQMRKPRLPPPKKKNNPC